ncbi:MAG: hemolysin III family protein [Eubacteriales bacterium]|nr:hemolysin III family protein [Eubacteriales bacterium]
MRLKDPVSSLTHYFGAVCAVLFGIPLIIRGFRGNTTTGTAMLIFVLGMLALYTASGTYHAIASTPRVNRMLKKWDHSMIFVLIAASYTPICMVSLGNRIGYIMLITVWTVAIIGILMKMIIVYHPKWISSVLYIAMGWICIFQVRAVYAALGLRGFLWLVGGGIMYTVGGVIYALKLKMLNRKNSLWGSHEIFHIFVLLGTLCHFIMMWKYIC